MFSREARRLHISSACFISFNFVQWLYNDTRISVYLREKAIGLFPIIRDHPHSGPRFLRSERLMWLDLRLLGLAMQDAPVTDVIEQLEPWAIGGFAVMFASGSLLILSEPLGCVQHAGGLPALKWSCSVLAAPECSVLFHKRVMHNSFDEWDRPRCPGRAKMVGIPFP